MTVGLRSLVVAAIFALGVCGSVVPCAATPVLVHQYRLDGTLADDLGGPSLTSNGGTLGATGLTFGANQGPSLSGALANSGVYSIVVDFSIDSTGGFRKLIDFKDRTNDGGLYNFNTSLNFFPVSTGPAGAITDGTAVRLALTRDGSLVNGYINGVLQISFTDGSGAAVFSGSGNIIRFFQDDLVTGGTESSSGFLDSIRIYSDALSANDVAALGPAQPPTGPTPVPEPATVVLVASGIAAALRSRRAARRSAATDRL